MIGNIKHGLNFCKVLIYTYNNGNRNIFKLLDDGKRKRNLTDKWTMMLFYENTNSFHWSRINSWSMLY